MGIRPTSLTSLEDLMAKHWEALPSGWQDTGALDRMKIFCRQMPPLSGVGVERELGSTDEPVAISLRLLQSDIGSSAFAGEWEGWTYPDAYLANEKWQAFRHFCRFWGRHAFTKLGHMPVAWLEVDGTELMKVVPDPCFFYGLERIQRDALLASNFLSEAHEVLTGEALSAPWLTALKGHLSGQPEVIERCWIGYMLSRPAKGIRLTVYLNRAKIEGLFTSLGQKPPVALERLFEPLNVGARLMVHLDCTEITAPRIGIEVPLIGLTVFQSYVRSELITGDEAIGLLKWGGVSPTCTKVEDIRSKSLQPNEKNEPVWVRKPSHLKFVFQPNRIQIKAYLYVGFGWN